MILEVYTTWAVTAQNNNGRTVTGTGTGFDTSTRQLVAFNETRTLSLLDPVPTDVQMSPGSLIYAPCAGTTLTEYFYAGNSALTTTVTPNSPTCGYAAPLTCDLGTATVAQLATLTGTRLTVSYAGAAHGQPQFALDGGPEQTSNVFPGVAAGAHVLSVRDNGLAGCTRTVSVTVASTAPVLPPPAGPSVGVDFVGQPLWYPLTTQPVGALVELELWAESAQGAADFALVLTLRKRIDASGRAAFRLDTLLWPLLRAFVPEAALRGATSRCTTNLVDYYVRTTVTPLDPALPAVAAVSDLRTALRGSLPAEWQGTDYFAYRLGAAFSWPPFLSWQPTGAGTRADGEAKRVVPGQPEWLFFLCPLSLATQQLQISRSYQMSPTGTAVVDVEPLVRPAEGWAQRLLAIPLRDSRAGFTYLTVQVQDASGNAVSLPASYQFVAPGERTRYLLFTNSVGGVDTFRTSDRARFEATLEATVEKTERPAQLGDGAPAADRQVSDLVASRKLKLATGWLLPPELEWLQELVLAREVWHQVGAQLRPLDWSKRSLAVYSDEPTLRGLLLECDYAYAPNAYAPVLYA